jgi:hypothetical protein
VKQRMRRSRMFGWDRNPLRRRIDRLEAAMITGLMALFLIVAPILATVAGHWAATAAMRTQRAQSAWRQVTAIVQRSAPGQQDDAPGPAGTAWARARWTAQDGQRHEGWVPVSRGAVPGARARVWIDQSGSLALPPLTRSDLRGSALSAARGVWCSVSAGLLAGSGPVGQHGHRRLATAEPRRFEQGGLRCGPAPAELFPAWSPGTGDACLCRH